MKNDSLCRGLRLIYLEKTLKSQYDAPPPISVTYHVRDNSSIYIYINAPPPISVTYHVRDNAIIYIHTRTSAHKCDVRKTHVREVQKGAAQQAVRRRARSCRYVRLGAGRDKAAPSYSSSPKRRGRHHGLESESSFAESCMITAGGVCGRCSAGVIVAILARHPQQAPRG